MKHNQKKKDVQNAQQECRLLTMSRGARFMGISYHSLRRMVIAGIIPSVKFPSTKNNKKSFRKRMLDIVDLERAISDFKVRKAV